MELNCKAGESRMRNSRLMRGLHCFEAVARHGSVKMAADELGVSQSAVSHQLRDLTESLGEQLFIRAGRGIALTATGRRLADKLATTFSGLQSSLDDIIGSGRPSLRLAVCSSFGPGWLIPRLASFYEANPAVNLQLRLYAQDPEQTAEVADAFVTAQELRPGFTAVHLLDEMLVAVASPRLCGSSAERDLPLITTDITTERFGQEWRDYCAMTGRSLEGLQSGRFLECTHYMLSVEMAGAGLGLALVPDFLARRHVEAGGLAYFDRMLMPSGRRYHLCFKKSRAQDPEVRDLVQWLRAERAPKPVKNLA
ncbi:LysR family transcriptional regulator [Aestuariivirga litoralis]|uniref:LysR family transcriptional regulator n=2 Tax=Aestuariivirga litoralis TaxID=2650924 RepID=A0A2W2ASH0_9HYPH|nr:LysR family transcriptional regulator [Aestuariivirga litoralis]